MLNIRFRAIHEMGSLQNGRFRKPIDKRHPRQRPLSKFQHFNLEGRGDFSTALSVYCDREVDRGKKRRLKKSKNL